jgi:hypothetical protein
VNDRGGHLVVRVVKLVQGQADLLEIVLALRAATRLPRSLHRRQQERDENANDRDHHQQLHERKPMARCAGFHTSFLMIRMNPDRPNFRGM